MIINCLRVTIEPVREHYVEHLRQFKVTAEGDLRAVEFTETIVRDDLVSCFDYMMELAAKTIKRQLKDK